MSDSDVAMMASVATNGESNGHVRTFRRSHSIAALVGALAKAQGMMHGAKANSENPHFKFKYADLAAVWDDIREPLSTNGLAVMQFPRTVEEGIEVEHLLAHESGEWVSETLELPVGKYDPQGVGSAITYARRYLLQSITGVAPEDDDGNAAAHAAQHSAAANGANPQARAKAAAAKAANPPVPALPLATQQQYDAFSVIVADLGMPSGEVVEMFKAAGVKRFSHLTEQNAAEMILSLVRRQAAKLMTATAFNMDDVRGKGVNVTGDTADELTLDEADAVIGALRTELRRQEGQ